MGGQPTAKVEIRDNVFDPSAGDVVDPRGLSPAESFVADTVVPPVGLLPDPDCEAQASDRLRRAGRPAGVGLASPVFLDDSDYPTPDPLTGSAIPEGNGHQAWFSSNNQFILGTDEDFSPTRTNCRIEIGPNAGATPCGEFGWTVPLATQFPSGFSGTTVWGGSGCEEDVDGNGAGDRAEVLANYTLANYTKAQTGADAIVFSRGVCFFSKKVETGELAGYKMVFVGQSHTGSRNGLLPDSFICGGQGSPVLGQASGSCIGHRAMHLLFDDAPAYSGGDTLDMPARGTLGARLFAQGGVFDGWGYVHLLNATTLQEIDAYAVPEALDPAFQTGFGNLTVHEVRTDPRANVDLAYTSYYSTTPASGWSATSSTRAATTSGGSSRSSLGTAGSRWSRPATATSACTCSATPANSPRAKRRNRRRPRHGPAPPISRAWPQRGEAGAGLPPLRLPTLTSTPPILRCGPRRRGRSSPQGNESH